jgi:hypothetical protein
MNMGDGHGSDGFHTFKWDGIGAYSGTGQRQSSLVVVTISGQQLLQYILVCGME